MANVHALMTRWDRLPKDATSYYWDITFNCMNLDGSGGFYDVVTHTVVNTTDSAVTVQTKVIDSIVAGIVSRNDGNVLPRTNVHLVDFVRGS